MSVVLCAYHEMGVVALETLLELRVPVARVYTHADDPAETPWFRSVADRARAAGLPVSWAEALDAPAELADLRSLTPDLLLSVHYRHVLPPTVLSIPRLGGVNLHPSLLPRYRGRAPLNWQLVHGERRSGVTLHQMVARVDAGPVYDQAAVAVGPDETASGLYARLVPAARTVLARTIPALLRGEATATPQDESRATKFGRRTPSDGRLDWQRPAPALHNLVRAVAPPWPGAYAELPDGRLQVWATRVCHAPLQLLAPGEVGILWGRTLVGTGEGVLELLEYRTPTGRALIPGERLGVAHATPLEVTP